jgi:hypothetical protein
MKPMEDAMNTLATKLTVTAAIAALIAVTPVSIDLVRATAGPEANTHLALSLDTAQARPMRLANTRHGNLGFANTGSGNIGMANTGTGNLGQAGRPNHSPSALRGELQRDKTLTGHQYRIPPRLVWAINNGSFLAELESMIAAPIVAGR